MLVRGVLRSWEMARSRFALIFSFSASISSFSLSEIIRACSLIFVVRALVIMEIVNIAIKLMG